MDQESSTKEEIQGSAFQISHSPSFFVEFFNAFLRCLGLGTVDHQSITQESSSNSSSEQEDEESSKDPPPTRTTDPQADPPTHISEDPSTDAVISTAHARRTPPVSRGGGGKINSTTS